MINFRSQNLYNNYNNNLYSKSYQKILEYYHNNSNNNNYIKNSIKNINVNNYKNNFNSNIIKKNDNNNNNKNFIEKNGYKFININNNVYNYYIFNQIINPYTNNNYNNKNIIKSQNPNNYLLNNNSNEQNNFNNNNNNFSLYKNINKKIEEEEDQNFPIFKLKLKIRPKVILQFTIGRNDNLCQTFEMFCTSYKIPVEFYKPILTFIFVSINKFYLLYNWEMNNENKKLLNEIYQKYVEKNNEKIFV